MSVFGDIWNFIKGLLVRQGLKEFLKKYQTAAVQHVEALADVHSGKGLHDWWNEAFTGLKAMAEADARRVHDNWIAILLNLAYETIRAKQESGK